MYSVFEKLLRERGITVYKFCKDNNISDSTIYTWKKRGTKCGGKLAETIASYFGVTLDYLMTGKNDELTEDERVDIARDMEKYSNRIKYNEGAPLFFNGQEIDEETKDLFLHELKSALTAIALINRKKDNKDVKGD